MSYIDKDDIMNATEGGLVIIESYYPGATHALGTAGKKFKMRGEEKTASASIRQKENGWYYVTDFGGDQKERNAIEVCMLEDTLTFAEACSELGARFSIKGAKLDTKLSMPTITKRPITKDEQAGTYEFEFKDYTKEDLAVIGPNVKERDCLDFNLQVLKSFAYRKENEVVTSEATDDYHIYSFHHKEWQKIYQPNSLDKGYRFRYAGTKPKKFIHGLDLLRQEFKKNKARAEEEYQEVGKEPDPRLDAAFIVSGGSDGINLRSFGHFPLWFNSESEQMEYAEYKDIMVMVKELYYVADLDNTGINQAVKLGLKYLDIRLLWLPKGLSKWRDKRGNPRKDFKDYVEVFYKPGNEIKFKNQLNKLIDNALPMKFWNEYRTDKGIKYSFKNSRAYHFLQHQGFGRYELQNSKDGFVWVWKSNGVVKIVRGSDVKGFVNQFLVERQMNEELRDMVYNTPRLNETSLTNLPYVEIDFTDADKESQHLFFKNEVWKVTAHGIERIKYEAVDRVTWEDKIVDKKVRIQEQQFAISKDAHGDWDIDIIKKDNQFLNYLINTSRVHWRKDLEEGFEKNEVKKREDYFLEHQFNIAAPNLDAHEILEQKMHLINKVFTLGYMLHKYKNPARPWAPYAMDHKIADISESHGGSGKSIFLKSIQYILKNNHYINGRDKKKTTDDFIYHGISEDTDYILVDDCHAYTDYGFFYNAITGDLDVNNKNGQRYIIPFSHSPKIAFASNFPPNALDPSLERRLLFTVFSDYYHYNKDGEYMQNRIVSDDFGGKSLFLDFTDAQWNDCFNFLAQCLQFYLGQAQKIDPPMENVTKRNLLKEMGDQFHSWADTFFSITRENGVSKNLDADVPKSEAFEEFMKQTNMKKMTSNRFKKSLKAYAKYNDWIFNPKDLAPDGRIMKKVGGETQEHFYVRTKPRTASDAPADAAKKNEDFLGFEDDDLNVDVPY